MNERTLAKMLRSLSLGIVTAAIALTATAQDTQYAPRGQQIPPPDCMNLHFAWQNVLHPVCSPITHERWLMDLEHWRSERRIRVDLRPVALRDGRAAAGPNPASCSRR